MKENYTHIQIVLDRSGSMQAIASDTIGGFNSFLKGQKEVEGKATLSLVQFDDQYEIVHDLVDITNVPELSHATFKPRGTTALYDAIGKTINSLGQTLHSMREQDKPESVVFVILTDGMENASREFNAGQVKEMIEHQKDKYNWQFMFIGANQDAVLTAKDFGIGASNSITFASNARGTGLVYDSLNEKIGAYRMTKSVASLQYNDLDRKEQEDAGA